MTALTRQTVTLNVDGERVRETWKRTEEFCMGCGTLGTWARDGARLCLACGTVMVIADENVYPRVARWSDPADLFGAAREELGLAREAVEMSTEGYVEDTRLAARSLLSRTHCDPEARAAGLLSANLSGHPHVMLADVRHARAVLERDIQEALGDPELMIGAARVTLRNELGNLEAHLAADIEGQREVRVA